MGLIRLLLWKVLKGDKQCSTLNYKFSVKGKISKQHQRGSDLVIQLIFCSLFFPPGCKCSVWCASVFLFQISSGCQSYLLYDTVGCATCRQLAAFLSSWKILQCYCLRWGGCVFAIVCLIVCKISGKALNGWLNFGVDADCHLDPGMLLLLFLYYEYSVIILGEIEGFEMFQESSKAVWLFQEWCATQRRRKPQCCPPGRNPDVGVSGLAQVCALRVLF